jgi:hypothetical protein
MKKPARKIQQAARTNGNGHSSKQEKLPSIDILIRKICRKDRSVGILAR